VLEIRAATEADHDAIWDIFHVIVAAGDTYAFEPEMSRQEALAYWFRGGTHTYVAKLDGLKPSSFQKCRAREIGLVENLRATDRLGQPLIAGERSRPCAVEGAP